MQGIQDHSQRIGEGDQEMIGICVLCGTFGEINAHHLGTNKIIVCADCHGKYHGYLGKRRDRHQRLLGEPSSLKLRELAIKHGTPSAGLHYLVMVQRIVKSSNNMLKDEEETLRAICKEMGSDYDDVFKKKEGKKG